MCAGGDLIEKMLTEAAQLLQKISKAAAMRRDWETRLAGEPEHNSRMKTCAEISKEATPEVTKEEPIPEKLEGEHIKSRTTPSIDFIESNETNKRSMSSAKKLRSSNKWIGFQSITEKYSTREDHSLTKRGWQERWKQISHWKRKRKIHTILKPHVRSFKSSLEIMKWIRNT
jgi:PP-loop superfamily ATP-utilizing enzyme